MERGLQRVNHHSHLAERSRRVETCRKSGRRVSEWCAEQGIPVSTYYSWQRKVFQAAVSENKVCFAEVPVMPAAAETAAAQKEHWGIASKPRQRFCTLITAKNAAIIIKLRDFYLSNVFWKIVLH